MQGKATQRSATQTLEFLPDSEKQEEAHEKKERKKERRRMKRKTRFKLQTKKGGVEKRNPQ